MWIFFKLNILFSLINVAFRYSAIEAFFNNQAGRFSTWHRYHLKHSISNFEILSVTYPSVDSSSLETKENISVDFYLKGINSSCKKNIAETTKKLFKDMTNDFDVSLSLDVYNSAMEIILKYNKSYIAIDIYKEIISCCQKNIDNDLKHQERLHDIADIMIGLICKYFHKFHKESWIAIEQILHLTSTNNIILINELTKTKLLKLAIRYQKYQFLSTFIPYLLCEPITDMTLLESLVRFMSKHPSSVLHVVDCMIRSSIVASSLLHEFKQNQTLLSSVPALSSYAIGAAIKSIEDVRDTKRQRVPYSNPVPHPSPGTLLDTSPNNNLSAAEAKVQKCVLLELAQTDPGRCALALLHAAELNQVVTVAHVVSASSLCNRINDWRAAHEVYRVSKRLLSSGALLESPLKQETRVHLADDRDRDRTLQFSSTQNYTVGSRGDEDATLPPARVLPSAVYGLTLISLAQGGAEAQAFQVCSEMLSAGVVPSTHGANRLFLELSRWGAHKALVRIADLFRRHRVPLSSLAGNALLNACNRAGAYRAAIEAYETRMKPTDLDPLALSVLIKSCDRLGDGKRAATVLCDAIATGMQVDTSLIERVFALLVKNADVDRAVPLLSYLENTVNAKSIQSTESQSRKNTWLGGYFPLVILRLLRDHENQVIITNNKLESWLTKSIFDIGFTKIGLQTVEEVYGLDESCIGDDLLDDTLRVAETQSFLIPALLESNVTSLQDLLLLNTPPVSPKYYAAVISCLSKAGLGWDALRLLESYRGRGGSELETMYTSAIHGFRSLDNGAHAAELTYHVLRFRTSAFKMKTLSHSANATARIDSNSPFAVTVASVNALLTSYVIADVRDTRTDWLMQEMHRRGFEPDNYTYTALIAGQQTAAATIDLYLKMRASNVKATSVTMSILLDACVQEKRGLLALEAVTHALEGGLPPTERLFVQAMQALKEEGKGLECLQALRSMSTYGVPTSRLCYGLCFDGLEKAGMWREAISLLVEVCL